MKHPKRTPWGHEPSLGQIMPEKNRLVWDLSAAGLSACLLPGRLPGRPQAGTGREMEPTSKGGTSACYVNP